MSKWFRLVCTRAGLEKNNEELFSIYKISLGWKSIGRSVMMHAFMKS